MYEVIGLYSGLVLFRGSLEAATQWAFDYSFKHNLYFQINHTRKVITFSEV